MPAPVFVIAFANNAVDRDRHLPALDAEFERLRAVLADSAAEQRWELVPSAETSIKSFLDLLQVERYQNRIALLHFAGHADGQSLLMESESGAPEVANAAGIAEFLAQHEGLGFLFLNACSTVGQVEALLAAGVPAIIATEHDINDAVATEFSTRFYKEFVNGQTLRKAFDAASAAVKANMTLKNAAQTRAISGVGRKRDPDDWPWKLHVREGNKNADQWSLGLALDDALWGIPEPEERPLPDSPFRHLMPFDAEHAPIFFGRRRETREVYDAIDRGGARRIVLLHGVSGAGKSSLLEAGLLPRLQRTREVVYLRRDPTRTLLGNLREALGLADAPAGAGPTELTDAWKAREIQERPLTVILDQVEEALSDSRRNGKQELGELVAALRQVFDQPAPPLGSIVLGFRKEWLAEVQGQLAAAKLASTDIFLDRLAERGIVEAVEGVTRDPRLRQRYALTIPAEDAGLGAEIAGDLVTDGTSAIAPTLQVLLTKMWDRSASPVGGRTFTRALYRELVKEGALLRDFIDQQLEVLHRAIPEASGSGLVLDVLAFHTSSLGDATRIRSATERSARWPEALQPVVARVIDLACTSRLMAVDAEPGAPAGSVGATRLGHDTLAPYLRRLATRSTKPVQRATRVIEERASDWTDEGGRRPLDASDLRLVERGLPSMRVLTPAETEMIEASRAQVRHAHRLRRRVRLGFAASAVVVVAVGAVAWWQALRAEAQSHHAAVAALVNSAPGQADPTDAALVLASLAGEAGEPAGGVQAALTVLGRPIPWATFTGHGDMIGSADFSPDGQHVLTASADGTARIWRRDGAAPAVELRGHTGAVYLAAYSPDGTLLVTAGADSTARVWRSDGTGTPVVLRHRGPVSAASFSPDGRTILTASADSLARLWPADGSGAPAELRGHAGRVTGAAFSRDGARILTWSDDRTARVWRTAAPVRPVVLRGHNASVIAAAFSPDGNQVVTGSDDNTARISRSDGSGTPVVLRGHGGAILGVAFSPDGNRVATASADADVRIWRRDGTGAPVLLSTHDDQVLGVTFSADGSRLLSWSADGSARVWATAGRAEPLLLGGHSGTVYAAAFSRDERWIVTAGNDGMVRLWPARPAGAAVVLRDPSGRLNGGAFSPDGRRVVTAAIDGVARVWNSDGSGAPVALDDRAGELSSAEFSADGERIVTGSRDGMVRVWRADGTGSVLRLGDRGAEVNAVSFSPTGDRVVSAAGGAARIWNIGGAGPPVTLRAGDRKILSAAFSPDGRRVVTGSGDFSARIWNADGTGAPLVLRGHRGPVLHATLSRDGSSVVTGSDDATARIWSSDGTGAPAVIRGHTSGVTSAALSPDGRSVITASNDGTVRITRRDGTGTPIVLRGHRGPVTSAMFSADGRWVLSTGADGSARVWPVTWPALVERLRASTTTCLAAGERMRMLGETRQQAADRAAGCVHSRQHAADGT